MERGDAVVKGLENDGRLWVEGKGSALVSMRKRDAGSITLRTRGDGVMIRPRGDRTPRAARMRTASIAPSRRRTRPKLKLLKPDLPKAVQTRSKAV